MENLGHHHSGNAALTLIGTRGDTFHNGCFDAYEVKVNNGILLPKLF